MAADLPAPTDRVQLERFESSHGETIGWIVRRAPERALWCGEISLRDLRRLVPKARDVLGNDLGWFLVEFDAHGGFGAGATVLAKVADEASGLRLAQALAKAP